VPLTSDPLPYAAFALTSLLKPLPALSPAARAISETEHPIEGDEWFWADDNAKVLELLSIPAVWRSDPAAVADILRFIDALCDGPFIFRRLGAPRLETRHNEGGIGDFLHSFMNIQCDLANGIVSLGMRFHDGRTSRNVTMTGNYVRFQHRRTVYTVDVEDNIFRHAVESTPSSVRLIWQARVVFGAGSMPWQRAQLLGVVTYVCTIQASSMFVDLEASLEFEPGMEASDVVLTFGYDGLSHNDNNVRYETISAVRPEGEPLVERSGDKLRFELDVEGAQYWCVSQNSHMAGFAAAVHSLPRDPARLHRLQVVCQSPGQLHWLVSEYRFPGSQSGRIEAAERKIITAGGFYDLPALYAETFTRRSRAEIAGGPAIDMSISYDYGAELNAFARCYRVMSSAEPPVADPGLVDALRKSVEHWHQVYQDRFISASRTNKSAIFSRSLAFASFAYADLLQATGLPAYAAALRETCELILGFERQNKAVDGSVQSGFVMGQEADASPYVDCHSSCLLALSRAAVLLDDTGWLASIDRGLAAFRLDTVSIFFLGTQKQDLVGVDYLAPDGTRRTMDTFWNFNSGLTLRLFGALRATSHVELKAVWLKHEARLDVFEMLMRQRIGRSLRPRGDAIEILTSMLSAEGNSETQPWVALGLVGDDLLGM